LHDERSREVGGVPKGDPRKLPAPRGREKAGASMNSARARGTTASAPCGCSMGRRPGAAALQGDRNRQQAPRAIQFDRDLGSGRVSLVRAVEGAAAGVVALGRRRFNLSARVCQQLQGISPRHIDRRLASAKRQLRTRRYGRTKPGPLLKHHIPQDPSLGRHGARIRRTRSRGPRRGRADGEFAHSLNVTDLRTTWVETRAVLGRGERRGQKALGDIRQALPFRLRGIDSDNGFGSSTTILYRYCQAQEIQFTRGPPYKKDDNAHIE